MQQPPEPNFPIRATAFDMFPRIWGRHARFAWGCHLLTLDKDRETRCDFRKFYWRKSLFRCLRHRIYAILRKEQFCDFTPNRKVDVLWDIAICTGNLQSIEF